MCTDCLVQVPVGIRCRECGKAVKMPTFDVQPTFYARAIGVGIGIAIGGGLLWSLANFILISIGLSFLTSLLGVGLGYAAAELISRAVNAKRSKGLAWIAAVSIGVAYLISLPTASAGNQLFGLIFVGVGIYIAVLRLR